MEKTFKIFCFIRYSRSEYILVVDSKYHLVEKLAFRELFNVLIALISY